MSSPNTSFLSAVNERNTLSTDFDNNRCGNTQGQGDSTYYFHDHCNVAKFNPSMNEHSNNASLNLGDFASFVHSQNLLQSRGGTYNTIDRASFHVEQNLPTDYNSNSFDKNIFETECQRYNLDMDIASRREPNNYRKINEKFVNFDIDPIPLANGQVSIFEGVTKRKHSLANHSYIDFSGVEDEKVTNSST